MNRIRSIINRIWPDPASAKLRLKVGELTDRLRESALNSDAKARQVSVLELRVKELESGKADLHRALTEAQKDSQAIYESPDITVSWKLDDDGKMVNSDYSVSQ